MAASNNSVLKEYYDTTKDTLLDPFLNFIDFTEGDETFILRKLSSLIGEGIRFNAAQLEDFHAKIAKALSIRKKKDITPFMVKERLMIMKCRLKLFQRFWAHPGVQFNIKTGTVRLHPLKYVQFMKQPIPIDKHFAEKGFQHYDQFCYCLQVKKLPIEKIKVITKFDRFEMGLYDSE